MKTIKKLLISILTISLVFTTTGMSFAMGDATSKDTYTTENGYTFDIEANNTSEVKLSYVEGETTYYMSFDKETREFVLEKETEDDSDNQVYSVSVESADSKGVEGTITLSGEEGSYELTDDEEIVEGQAGARAAWAIPIGIGLSEEFIAALLALAKALVIASVACVTLSEVAYEIENQDEYRYFRAFLRDDQVYVGDGVSTRVAKDIMAKNNRRDGVVAITTSYGLGLCQSLGGAIFDNPHDSAEGYWAHYHCVNYPKAHCWLTY